MQGQTLDAAIGDKFPPVYFRDANDNIVGFTPDLAAKVSTMLNVKFKFQAVSFAAVLPGVQSGKYQLALSSADITDVRVATVDMIPVTSGGYTLMVRTDASNPPSDLASACGKTVAITAGGNEANILADQSKKLCKAGAVITVSTFPDQVNAGLAVKSGRADAAFIGANTAGYMQTNDPGWKLVGDPIVFNNQGWIVPKGSGLGPALAAAINQMIADGTYQQLLDKWHLSQTHLQGNSVINKIAVG
jgi:polar amino acid transport system substrate-binding protein